MEKIIKINDKEIKFKASGATIRIYREKFGRDLLMDMQSINEDFEKKNFSSVSLECFENLAFVMAKQANPDIPDNPDDWLDEFDMFSIYEIMPQIVDLWNVSTEPKIQAKKKGARPNVK